MKLFRLNNKDGNYHVEWEEQTLLLKAFRPLYKRDRSTGKVKANKELSFVYFFCDIQSDYNIFPDDEERAKAIAKDLELGDNWKIDDKVQDAIDFYNSMSTSVTAKMLKDNIYVADKLSRRFKDMIDSEDLEIDDMKKILDSIKAMPSVIKSLQEAEKAVLKEIEKANDRLGVKEKALFEDGI